MGGFLSLPLVSVLLALLYSSSRVCSNLQSRDRLAWNSHRRGRFARIRTGSGGLSGVRWAAAGPVEFVPQPEAYRVPHRCSLRLDDILRRRRRRGVITFLLGHLLLREQHQHVLQAIQTHRRFHANYLKRVSRTKLSHLSDQKILGKNAVFTRRHHNFSGMNFFVVHHVVQVWAGVSAALLPRRVSGCPPAARPLRCLFADQQHFRLRGYVSTILPTIPCGVIRPCSGECDRARRG